MNENISLEQLNNRLEEINKQMDEIEKLSNNPNVEVVTITASDGISKGISKEKLSIYMSLVEERQRIINQIRLLSNQSEIERKDNLDYQIINRETHFKEGTFQKINGSNSILSTTKENIRFIEEPFRILREQNTSISSRDDLSRGAGAARDRRRMKDNTKKRLLVDDTKGFISNAAFIIITSIFITVLIFLTVGIIVFK